MPDTLTSGMFPAVVCAALAAGSSMATADPTYIRDRFVDGSGRSGPDLVALPGGHVRLVNYWWRGAPGEIGFRVVRLDRGGSP